MGNHDREKSGAETVAASSDMPVNIRRAGMFLTVGFLSVLLAVLSVCIHGGVYSGTDQGIIALTAVTGMTVPVIVPSGQIHRAPERIFGPANLAVCPGLSPDMQREGSGFQPLLQEISIGKTVP